MFYTVEKDRYNIDGNKARETEENIIKAMSCNKNKPLTHCMMKNTLNIVKQISLVSDCFFPNKGEKVVQMLICHLTATLKNTRLQIKPKM